MSNEKKVLTFEDFEEFLRDHPIKSPDEYPLSEETLNKFFEYVKEGMKYAKKKHSDRRD